MRRIILLSITACLLFASLAAPAGAAKKKKKPKPPKPVPVTLYAHGPSGIGNMDQAPAPVGGGTYLSLDGVEPEGSSSKSFFFYSVATSPNPNCAGNSLVPVFVGPFSGRVTGDMKFTFSVQSTPTTLDIRVFPDTAGQMCNDEYVPPVRSALVDVSSGQVEATISGADFDVQSVLMIQVSPGYETPNLTRLLYDSTTDPTNLQLTCLPAAGATSCI